MKRWILGLAAVALVGAAAVLWGRSGDPGPAETEGVAVPALTMTAMQGAALFSENCEACHGPSGSGSENGPPLIHRIYEPNHHGDAAFYLAALRGTRSHHWQFGDMPPVDGVTEDDVGKIVVFVREVQRANGID